MLSKTPSAKARAAKPGRAAKPPKPKAATKPAYLARVRQPPPEPRAGRRAKSGALPITVSIKRACEITGLGLSRIYDLLGDGRLDSVYVDARRLVVYRSLERLLGVADDDDGATPDQLADRARRQLLDRSRSRRVSAQD